MSTLVVPVGMKFLPTDAELVGCYLYRKITGMALPLGVIPECDLYGEENPWEIWERYRQNVVKCVEGEDLYLFTKLKKKSPKAKRIERRIGIGRWEGESGEVNILDPHTGHCIGCIKRLRFEKSQTPQDGGWIMHEYSINPSLIPPPSFQEENNFVVCRIRKNKRIIKDEGCRFTKRLKRDTTAEEGNISESNEDILSNMLSMQEGDDKFVFTLEQLLDNDEEDNVLPSQPLEEEEEEKEVEPQQHEEKKENEDQNILGKAASTTAQDQNFCSEEEIEEYDKVWFSPFSRSGLI